jgi:uncharacterized repeat protein (TIGR03803 family)
MGFSPGCGTVFSLRPQPRACTTALCPWKEAILYSFTGGADGALPAAEVTFDPLGSLYGTTADGGQVNQGTVFQLTHSGGNWTQSVLYSFTGGSDGSLPTSGLLFDKAGNLYGTTYAGGLFYGTVFQLTPSGSGWMEDAIYEFQGGDDGGRPQAGLISDTSGNLYGATSTYGPSGNGTAFELTLSQGGWKFSVLYGFAGVFGGPRGNLVMDATGNLYGTTYGGGANGVGSVFKLTLSNGTWTYTSLHDFTGGTDGAYPYSNLVFDANGNLYGTASSGGANRKGVVFEITP